jgi:hypothetical protein
VAAGVAVGGSAGLAAGGGGGVRPTDSGAGRPVSLDGVAGGIAVSEAELGDKVSPPVLGSAWARPRRTRSLTTSSQA